MGLLYCLLEPDHLTILWFFSIQRLFFCGLLLIVPGEVLGATFHEKMKCEGHGRENRLLHFLKSQSQRSDFCKMIVSLSFSDAWCCFGNPNMSNVSCLSTVVVSYFLVYMTLS